MNVTEEQIKKIAKRVLEEYPTCVEQRKLFGLMQAPWEQALRCCQQPQVDCFFPYILYSR